MHEIDFNPPLNYQVVNNQTRLMLVMYNLRRNIPYDFENLYNQFGCFNYKSPFSFLYDFFFFQNANKRKIYHCVMDNIDLYKTEITTLQQFYELYYHYSEPHVTDKFIVATLDEDDEEGFILPYITLVENEIFGVFISNAFELADLMLEINASKEATTVA